MSDLPPGWVRCELGDLAAYITSGSRDWSKYYSNQGALFVRTENINRNRLGSLAEIAHVSLPDSVEGKRTLIRRDDLLITITGANVGKCAHVSIDIPEAYVSQSVALVRLVDCSLSRFVQKQLIAPGPDGERTLLQESAYGLGRPVLNLDNVRKVPLVLAPALEQRRIADKLDAVFARVDACRERLDRVPAILKRFRQSVLAAATSGKLTEGWREERGIAGKTAGRWPLVTVGELCEHSFYGPRFGKSEYTDSKAGVPTIRTTDMTGDGRIEVTGDTPRVVIPSNKLEYFRVRKGDLLVTRTGSIGVMAVFEGDYEAIPSAYLIRFRFTPRVLSRYMFFCLMAPEGQKRLGLSATAITQPNINAEAIKRIEIRLPDLVEQDEVIRRVDSLFTYAARLEAGYPTARNQIERLTLALLAKAFRGDLVPQDPNDEPASVLLERIRAARASTPDRPPTRRPRGRPAPTQKAEVDMLTRKDIQDEHLTIILKDRGPLTAEALWAASQLDIDDFYDQLKDEEARGLLKERRTDGVAAQRLLVAA